LQLENVGPVNHRIACPCNRAVLQCVTVCNSVLQCVEVFYSMLQ